MSNTNYKLHCRQGHRQRGDVEMYDMLQCTVSLYYCKHRSRYSRLFCSVIDKLKTLQFVFSI